MKSEVASAMSFAYSFLKDGDICQFQFEYIGVEAFKACGSKLMHAISPFEAAEFIASGQPIEWLNKSTFQDYTEDYVQGIAKRYVSELENGIRKVIVRILANRYGANWWATAVSNKVRQSTEKMYEAQEGIITTDGAALISFTFLLDLRRIIVSNWGDFDPVFKNQARFTQLLEDLNDIRRIEAHNREMTAQQLDSLKSIHQELMDQVAMAEPSAASNYLVENWRIQLHNIFSNVGGYQFPESQRSDLDAAISVVEVEIRRYEDLEVKVRSVLVPPGKKELHDMLIDRLGKVKESLIEVLEAARNNDLDNIDHLQEKNKNANEELRKFQEIYLMSEL
ncbi:MAG: Swt1 family HEPN domain-containing protein [Cyanobacteria bacterium P01_C01_bin.121]